jgi:hypothetical protein
MKTSTCLTTLFALATSLYAGPADDVVAAVKKIADAPNYSWTTTTEIADSQFPAMPSEGAAEKLGFSIVTRSFNGNTSQTVRKGEEVVMQNRDGDWVTMEEMRAQFGGGNRGGGQGAQGGQGGQGGGNRGGGRGFGGGMFGGGGVLPAATAANFATKLKNLKVDGDTIVGTASGDEASALLAMPGGRGGQGQGPRYSLVEVKFWVKSGALVKYTVHSVGKFSTPDGEEREMDSTTTTEIKNVGSTKVEVPEGAKKKFKS